MAKETEEIKKSPITLPITLAIIIFLIFGFLRIYTGSYRNTNKIKGIDVLLGKVVFKDDFSFKDTFINIDDVLEMPRIAVATNHTAVKRQLEEMNIIDTDDEITYQVTKSILDKYTEAYNKTIEEYNKSEKEKRAEMINNRWFDVRAKELKKKRELDEIIKKTNNEEDIRILKEEIKELEETRKRLEE